jgi:hypothetical protein
MAVDYEWRLRVLMAEHGMFRAIDLAPRLAEHGILLSDSQVWRLVTRQAGAAEPAVDDGPV